MTTATSIRSRRSVALLLVVAALAIVAVGAASLAALAATAKAAASLDRSEALAAELLLAVQAPIDHWLSHEASKAVVPPEPPEPPQAPDASEPPEPPEPPEVAMPAVVIVDESWMIEGVEVTLRATAFDQLGMVPWSHARGGSTLRLVLPDDVLAAVARADGAPGAPPGLDLVVATSDRQVFPVGPGSAAPPGLGALVATHGSAPARINVNTAPPALLEQAFRAAGRGGVDAVLANRARGRPAPVPPPRQSGAGARPAADDPAAEAWRVELVGSSDAWAFRIDVRVGRLRRSWWEVHRPGSEGKWECVQRLVVLE